MHWRSGSGIDGYNDKTEDEWLREFTAEVIPDFEAFKEAGLARMPAPKYAVAFAEFCEGPDYSSAHDAVRQDRDLLDDAGTRPQPLWIR